MRVVHFLAMREVAGFNVEPYLLVSVAERHALACQAVNFFYTEDKQVFIVVKDMLVHLDFIHDIGGHLQTVFQFLEGRQEDFLDDLQVAKIARRQVVGNHHDLLGQRLELVALGTRQFKDIGILLVRHDAGTGSAVVGKLDKAEVLAVEHAGIESQLGNSTGNAGQRKGNIALHLSTSHLCIHHVVVQRIESQ